MAELKQGFEELEFGDVKTYLNSGNVIFSSEIKDIMHLKNAVEAMIKERFGMYIPVFVIAKTALEGILSDAPDWWGDENKEIYDNLIFVIPPTTADEVFNELGEPKQELEKVKGCGEAVFWSFSRKDYQKTNWWSKTASPSIGNKLTIRTAGTVRKIVEM